MSTICIKQQANQHLHL